MATERHLQVVVSRRRRRPPPFDWGRFWSWLGLFALSVGAIWGSFDLYLVRIPQLLAELIA